MTNNIKNSPKNEKVAGCTSLAMQPATNSHFSATNTTTTIATNTIKALASKVLERNERATNAQLMPKNPATNCPKKPPIRCRDFASQKMIICGDCLNFKCHNKHGKGAGLCLAGIGFVLWSDTLHECGTFDLPIAN